MKIINLKQLVLKNFKGIKDMIIDFDKVTNIFGDNGAGKTTICDAFTWLLFGKDSHDISKFDVQPLDSQGNTIHMLETEVTGILVIDGIETTLRKVLKEKWVKKHGETEAELKGTTTDYYVNEVPQKEKEYQQKISEIIPEDIFKLLTNPLYFSSTMKWQDRRKIIFDINGDVSQADVINYNDKLAGLNKFLNPNESMDDFNKRIKAQITKLKKDQANIPARVDEANRGIQELNFNALEEQKNAKEFEIKNLEEQILDGSKVNDVILQKKDKLYQLKDKLRDIEYKEKQNAQKPLDYLRGELQGASIKLGSKQRELKMAQNDVKYKEQELKKKEEQRQQLLNRWHEENEKKLVFDENEFVCPTCHRPFEAEDIEAKKAEMQENFNENKAKNLQDISTQGKNIKVEIEALQAHGRYGIDAIEIEIKNLEAESKNLKKQIAEFKPVVDYSSNSEYKKLSEEIQSLENEIQQCKCNDTSSLRSQKVILEGEIELINKQLYAKGNNNALKIRIEELKGKEKEIAQQIADLEKAQNLADEFTRTKVELLENSINSKFKLVKIRLFKNQVNGGLEEDCEVMVNGVPFGTNLNSGMRINAGLDIINTLSEHYGVLAPIFVDNKESVTQLIDTNCQTVNLIVSEPDKKLRIESEDK